MKATNIPIIMANTHNAIVTVWMTLFLITFSTLLSSVNKFLQDGGIKYELVSKRETSRKSESYGKYYWLIQQVTQ